MKAMKYSTFLYSKEKAWSISSEEVSKRLVNYQTQVTNSHTEEISDLMISFKTPDGTCGEWEFCGIGYDGFAMHSEGFCYIVYPTLSEINEREDFLIEMKQYTGREFSKISFHDIAMCYGILFLVDKKMFNSL